MHQDNINVLRNRLVSMLYGEGYSGPQPVEAIRLLRERPDLVEGDSHLACALGDEAALQAALNADPDWVRRSGGPLNMPPLIAVTHSGLLREPEFAESLLRCAKLLLDHGADPNQTWINPNFPDSPLSALYGAAGLNHHPGMTQLLLARGANPNDGESLYHSVESSDLTCTRLLLESGAAVHGTNAIGRVLDYDRLEGLRLLIEHGGDAGKPGASEFPLFHAIRRGRSVEHVHLLLNAGADKRRANRAGMTPYRFALFYGRPDIAALLGASDGDEEFSSEERFVIACACGDRKSVFQQLADDPGILQRLSEKQLRQLPNMAAQQNLAAVKLMVEAGWPISVAGGDWRASALNLAVYAGNAEMTEFLLEHGASWQEQHGFGGNVMGTLSFASKNNVDVDSGDWLGCAKSLIAHRMPLPSARYEFSPELTEYFENLRATTSASA